MPKVARDPLLAGTRIFIFILLAACAIGAIGCLIGIPAFFLLWGDHTARILAEYPNADLDSLAWALPALLAASAALLALGFGLLNRLRQIIDSVGQGDPFIPANAKRLFQMGWIVLAGQLLAIPVGGLAITVGRQFADGTHDHAGWGVGVSPNGLLLALVLFILARVFQTGAAMRDDLEGTV